VSSAYAGFSLDWVEVDVSLLHTHLGDLKISLTSPTGTRSVLMDRPGAGNNTKDNLSFTFSTTHDWGESPVGTWTLQVEDAGTGGSGSMVSYGLRFYGDNEGDDDLYVYTDEFATLAGARGTWSDSAGNDTVNAAAVSTAMTLDLSGGTSEIAGRAITLASGTVIENAIGGDGDDAITGNFADNRLAGGRGEDVISGGAGADDMSGDAGEDELRGDSGHDRIQGGAGADLLIGGADADVMTGGEGRDVFEFRTGDGFDRITDFATGAGGDVLHLVDVSPASLRVRDYHVADGFGGLSLGTNADTLLAQGDFDADGRLDLLFRGADASITMWTLDGNGVAGTVDLGTFGHSWSVLGGDEMLAGGTADLLAGDPGTGDFSIVSVNGSQLSSINLGKPLSVASVVATGDFIGYGSTNMLIHNRVDNHMYLWWVDPNSQGLAGIDLGAYWAQVDYIASGNFFSYGMTDLLVRNRYDNHLYMWWVDQPRSIVDGADLGSIGHVDIVATGDFNGSGRTSLLVRNPQDQHMYVWWADQATGTLQGSDLGQRWSAVDFLAAGNFGGDERTEFLVRNKSDSHVYLWYMHRDWSLQGVDLGVVGKDWDVLQTGDYDRDGYTDVLWRNVDDHRIGQWTMDNYGNGAAGLTSLQPQAQTVTVLEYGSNGRIQFDGIEPGEIDPLQITSTQHAGPGAATLTGGAGDDTFVFAANFGHVTVTDFEAGNTQGDVIEIRGGLFADFAAVQAAAAQVGADVLITLDAGNDIRLKNVALAQLHHDDFVFV
jgi:subtilisin-like proprotein convertase family protein